MPWFHDMSRSACRLAWSAGFGRGGVVVTLKLPAPEQLSADWLEALRDNVTTKAIEQAQLTHAELWQGDQGVSRRPSAERELRRDEDEVVEQVLILESTNAASLLNLRPAIEQVLLEVGGAPVPFWLYQLIYSLSAHELPSSE